MDTCTVQTEMHIRNTYRVRIFVERLPLHTICRLQASIYTQHPRPSSGDQVPECQRASAHSPRTRKKTSCSLVIFLRVLFS